MHLVTCFWTFLSKVVFFSQWGEWGFQTGEWWRWVSCDWIEVRKSAIWWKWNDLQIRPRDNLDIGSGYDKVVIPGPRKVAGQDHSKLRCLWWFVEKTVCGVVDGVSKDGVHLGEQLDVSTLDFIDYIIVSPCDFGMKVILKMAGV